MGEPRINEHGEAVCPDCDGVLDLHSDGTYHCWRGHGSWDLDNVRETHPRPSSAGLHAV